MPGMDWNMNTPNDSATPAAPASPVAAEANAAETPATPGNGTRRRVLLLLTAGFLSIALLWTAYWFFVTRWQESTDDAYVAGHVVQITPQVAGTVRAVFVDDTDTVAAGETLVALDDADSQVAVHQAEAELARVVREARALHINNDVLRAQITARRSEVDRLTRDLSRRQSLAQRGAVAQEEIDHTREALKAARANLLQAEAQLAANRVLTGGGTVESQPAVMQAVARLEDAWLAAARTRIVAPVAGQVVKRNAQVGQKVNAGAPLMAVVPLEQLWVDANFKEVQLSRMRVGQRVRLQADVYGSEIRYRGRVAGFAAGTGNAFALLPAQNATGNWIKIVQRVPVRIELEPEDLAAHPLRIGLSMRVTVDLKAQAAEEAARPKPQAASALPETASGKALEAARLRAAEIIRAHDGTAP
jgi:membrane fusion protein (multidrug efflux system)